MLNNPFRKNIKQHIISININNIVMEDIPSFIVYENDFIGQVISELHHKLFFVALDNPYTIEMNINESLNLFRILNKILFNNSINNTESFFEHFEKLPEQDALKMLNSLRNIEHICENDVLYMETTLKLFYKSIDKDKLTHSNYLSIDSFVYFSMLLIELIFFCGYIEGIQKKFYSNILAINNF